MDTIGLHIPPSVLEYGTPVFNADERMERPRMETFRVKKLYIAKLKDYIKWIQISDRGLRRGGGGRLCSVAWGVTPNVTGGKGVYKRGKKALHILSRTLRACLNQTVVDLPIACF